MTMPPHNEPKISLGELSRRSPVPSNPRTFARWILRGVQTADGNRVFLEAVRVGGRWMTSEAALDRFFDALTAAARPPLPPGQLRSPTARTRASEAAEAELKKLGA